jgi:hypothetical protein
MKMMPNCKRCDDTFWVCEAHDSRPWDRDRDLATVG